MILGVMFNLRTWLKRKNGHLEESQQTNIELRDNVAEAATTGEGEVEGDTVSISSRATSVFNTVGLRRRALQLLHMRKENVGS